MEDVLSTEKTLDKRDLRWFIERLASSGVLTSAHAPSQHSYSTSYTLTLFFDSDARIVRWNSRDMDFDDSFISIVKRQLLNRSIEPGKLDGITGIEVESRGYSPCLTEQWLASVDFETGACHACREHGDLGWRSSGKMDLSLDRDGLAIIIDTLAVSGVLDDNLSPAVICDGTWYTMKVFSKTGTRIIEWNCGNNEVDHSFVKLLNTMLISRVPLTSPEDRIREELEDLMRDYPKIPTNRDD